MLQIFRSNYAFINVLLAVLTGACGFFVFICDIDYQHTDSGPLSFLLNEIPDSFRLVLGAALLFAQGLILNTIFNNAPFANKASSVPAMIYILACLYDPRSFYLQGDHIFISLFMLGLLRLNKVMRNFSAIEHVFVYGVLIGIACLFYVPAFVAVIFAWILLMVFRPFVWREYLAPFFGFSIAPLLVIFVQLFKHSGSLHLLGDKTHYGLIPEYTQKELWYLGILFAGIILLLGLRYFIVNHSSSTVRIKKLGRINLLGLGYLAAILYLGAQFNYPAASFSAAGLLFAFVCSFYFMEVRKRPFLQSLIFYIFIGILIGQATVTHIL